ncbi:GntR family transcriptional regulator [Alkalihalobacillus alcalophilus ATCC 27647 = CGMCC 1.3604]|uniref:GntR family transcriptional regulator n=1 Tax=Alkalihalobacillus alcalophilus ATCC 27647 = CGMCC 1.3604 TaxID=1218173 RepID=A0A094WPX8_ALKAL|nr:GntR family transcriptional regulator [Alkalihalobacillus alcalophilus]KGA98871.1 GntR family transcriptional regulator [Alkalihalobacillus alcalophilus ATCC 27647 = CGMCC 1.3604]MED1560510.1 GntR family transcriptional regulator [Alkalihalobacillus alcalophilus]THG91794.1 GntR family transcriptional regulator [Alkalihalobacillus alcalophilus ATCC 27647 = CGMCC 1.3604]
MILEISERTEFSSTRDYVYHVLRENIISLKLEPGLNISEKEISEKLQVSRTPVREAFVKLVQDELLEVFPQKGSFVALIDLKHVEEARFIREHLEIAAIQLACKLFSPTYLEKLEFNLYMQKRCVEVGDYKKFFELDEEFHETISEGCGKKRIWMIIQQMNTHLNRVRMLSLTDNYNWNILLSQHEGMIEAIRAQDSLKAKEIVHHHLTLVNNDQGELKVAYPNYFK